MRERLLEYDIKQGWKPITTFLGLPEFIGTVERNSASDFIDTHSKVWNIVMINTAKNLGKASLILSAAEVKNRRLYYTLIVLLPLWIGESVTLELSFI